MSCFGFRRKGNCNDDEKENLVSTLPPSYSEKKEHVQALGFYLVKIANEESKTCKTISPILNLYLESFDKARNVLRIRYEEPWLFDQSCPEIIEYSCINDIEKDILIKIKKYNGTIPIDNIAYNYQQWHYNIKTGEYNCTCFGCAYNSNGLGRVTSTCIQYFNWKNEIKSDVARILA